MLLDARRAEIIGDAAEGEHQRVVAEGSLRGYLASVLIEGRGQMHLFARAV